MAFRGALVRKALDNNGSVVNQPVPHGQVPYPVVTFNQVIYDSEDLWSMSENCFVIPSMPSVSKVRFTAQVVFATDIDGARQILVQRKSVNNVSPNSWEFFSGQPIQNGHAIEHTTNDLSFASAVLQVVAGDKYALMPWQTSGGTLDISGGTGTFFGIEIVE